MLKFNYREPYETTYGLYLKSDKIETELKKYIIRLNKQEDICYNCSFPDAVFYIITGKNELEKELPYFELPYVFQNLKGQRSVAIDARQFCREITGNINDIEPFIKDKHNYNFLTISGFLTAHMLEKKDSVSLNPIRVPFITAFSLLLMSSIERLITLNPINKVQIEIALSLYAYCMFSFNSDLSNPREKTEMINTLVSKKYSLPMPRNTIIENIELILSNVDSSAKGLRRLETFIFSVLPEEYRKQINITTITELLSKAWVGVGGKTTMFASLECFTLFIAMMYNLGENNFLKKNNILGMILDKNEKIINNKEVVRFIKSYIEKNYGHLIS